MDYASQQYIPLRRFNLPVTNSLGTKGVLRLPRPLWALLCVVLGLLGIVVVYWNCDLVVLGPIVVGLGKYCYCFGREEADDHHEFDDGKSLDYINEGKGDSVLDLSSTEDTANQNYEFTREPDSITNANDSSNITTDDKTLRKSSETDSTVATSSLLSAAASASSDMPPQSRSFALSSLYNSLAEHLSISPSDLPSPPSSVSPVHMRPFIERPSAPPPPPPIPLKSPRRNSASMHFQPLQPRSFSVASVEDLGLAPSGAPVPSYIRPTHVTSPSLRVESGSSSRRSSRTSFGSNSSSSSSPTRLHYFDFSSTPYSTPPSTPGSTFPPLTPMSSIPSFSRGYPSRGERISLLRCDSLISNISSGGGGGVGGGVGNGGAKILRPRDSLISNGTTNGSRTRASSSSPSDGGSPQRLRHRTSPKAIDLRQLRIKDSEACLQRAYETQTEAYLEGTMFAPSPAWRQPRTGRLSLGALDEGRVGRTRVRDLA